MSSMERWSYRTIFKLTDSDPEDTIRIMPDRYRKGYKKLRKIGLEPGLLDYLQTCLSANRDPEHLHKVIVGFSFPPWQDCSKDRQVL